MSYLMGIDLGTSSVKTVIMDENGSIKGTAQQSYEIIIEKSGYAEQDPNVWWKAVVWTIKHVLNKTGIHSKKIKGIGFSGQMHGLVMIDRNLLPIRPAIIWSDQRSRKEVAEIYSIVGRETVKKLLMNSIFTGFQMPSLLWIKKNEPFVYEKINKVLLPKDYIRLKLTGECGTDFTDASATLAFDIQNRKWAFELIKKVGLNPDFYPEVHESIDIAGQVTVNAAEETGLAAGTPVVYGGGDQSMQSIGNGIVKPGQVSLTIGTGGQTFSIIPEPIYETEMRTHTFCNAVPQTWNIMGANLAAGLSLSWLNKKILNNLSYSEINELAKQVTPGSEGLLFLPYLSGERTPHMDDLARGTFLGLTLQHSRAHLIRSVMEGVVFALKDSIEIFHSLNIKMDTFIASGGGARSDVWLKIQANILNKEIYKVNQLEQACTGAAITAGVGIGKYDSIQSACETIIRINPEPVRPDPTVAGFYNEIYELYKNAYVQNKQLFHQLAMK